MAAARKLMGPQGWNATTIDAIADEAGVATPTVYAAFGNKRAVIGRCDRGCSGIRRSPS